MSDIVAVIHLVRAVTQLGVTAEQYQFAVNNPDMSDEKLEEILTSNSNRIQDLIDKDHN